MSTDLEKIEILVEMFLEICSKSNMNPKLAVNVFINAMLKIFLVNEATPQDVRETLDEMYSHYKEQHDNKKPV